eukprot:873633-Rhodomonas_salina.4
MVFSLCLGSFRWNTTTNPDTLLSKVDTVIVQVWYRCCMDVYIAFVQFEQSYRTHRELSTAEHLPPSVAVCAILLTYWASSSTGAIL